MPRPAESLLQAKLYCAPTVDNVSAISACEAAAGECGFHVAARTRRSVVLMPNPARALFSCLAPGQSAALRGAGITAELVADADKDGLSVSISTPRTPCGESFVSALNAQLESLGTGLKAEQGATANWEEHRVSPSSFRSEAQAYYFYSKILYDVRNPAGAAAAEFTNEFLGTCGTLSPTALEQSRPVAECLSTVERLCALVDDHLVESAESGSCPSSNVDMASKFRPWLRSSVERCLFTRVGRPLWCLYERRHSAADAQYTLKAQALASISDAALLDALEVRSDFRCVRTCPKQHRSADASIQTPSTAAGTDGTATSASTAQSKHDDLIMTGSYDRAAAALSQIEMAFSSGRCLTPREAVEELIRSQLEMKTCALESSGGLVELHAMDDIMPVFIFVLVRSSLARPLACASFMSDALTADERLESEGRAVLLLESAARHVAYEWDFGALVETLAT